jgi:ferric-dicitrate binding protein FerR (iron transport regulator)
MDTATTTSQAAQTVERRTMNRPRTLKSGKLVYGGGFARTVIDCLVVDLSEDGVRVETSAMTMVPETARLRLSDGSELAVRRCWAQGNVSGFAILAKAA